MNVAISKDALGEQCHLVQVRRNGPLVWLDELPEDTWTFGGAPGEVGSVEELSAAICQELPQWPPERFSRGFSQILKDPGRVRWSQVIPKAHFKNHLQTLLRKLWDIVESPDAVSYGRHVRMSQKLFCSLSRAHVDPKAWSDLRRSEKSGQEVLISSFIPTGRVCQTVTYSRVTSTGRMTVTSGPEILRLKRAHRAMLRSKFSDGTIYQADYSSLEPRVLASLTGSLKHHVDDVYTHLSREVLSSRVSRDQVKVVVMAILFGVGMTHLRTLLDPDVDVVRVVSEVRDFFNVRQLETRLLDEMKRTGRIRSYHGRILHPPRHDGPGLVCYFVQATSVDVVVEGFTRVVDRIRSDKVEVNPIFLLHDAVFLDVSPEVDHAHLRQILNAGEEVSDLPGRFPLEFKPIGR